MILKLPILNLSDISPDSYRRLTNRSAVPDNDVRTAAAAIVREVELNGDRAVASASEQFGGGLPDGSTRISPGVIADAVDSIPDNLAAAIRQAAVNVRHVHEQQVQPDTIREPMPGVRVERRWSAIDSVGVYVPGGRAAYPSSVIMGVVPAQIAGVPRICIATPTGPDGSISQVVLAAAGMLGVEEIHAVGGAQAIGALAYGTETIDRVSKIVGPGGPWVTAAKLAVFGACGIDLPAGPSEAAIVADSAATVSTVAADVMCQAEHGAESAVLVAVPSTEYADRLLGEIETALEQLPRSEIIAAALNDFGMIVVCDTKDAALILANDWAPEHLSLHTVSAETDVDAVPNAGSVFVGKWSSEAAGDYATGANHVLPTGGLARSYGPLSVEDFGSYRQVQTLTRDGLAGLADTILTLASAEGLQAHAYSVTARLDGGQ